MMTFRTTMATKSLLLLVLVMVRTKFVTATAETRTNLFTMEQTSSQVGPQPRALDLRKCYYDLLAAAGYDSTVTQSDFITFIQLSSNHTLGYVNQWGINITGFNMLNPEFVGIYNLYACGDPLVGCPSIEGIDIGVGGSALQVSDGGGGGLLSGLCGDLYEVIDTLTTSSPTKGPSVGGTTATAAPSTAGAVPTSSPSSAATTGEGTPTYYPSYIPTKSPTIEGEACPLAYKPNTFYQAFDKVTNPNDGSGGKDIYECKDAPYTPWCSQAAYEPGVALPWGEAWSLVGQCNDEVVNPDITTIPATTTEAPSTTSATTPTVSPSGSGSTGAPATGAPTAKEGVTSSPVPVNPDDSLYTGALLVDFQYEVGNDQFLNAQAIETGEPENNMMAILLDSTEALVEQVVADTYGRRGLRLAEVRNLRVTYASKTTAIQNLTDIFCPSSEPGSVLCQKLFCQVELVLSNEPKLSTELKFKNGLYKAIDNGDMMFPPDSGVVYSSSPRPVSVISEVISKEPDEGGGSTDGDDDTNSSSWVVPVSITVAVLGILLIALLIGLHVIRTKHKNEAELVQNSLDGDDISGDIKGPEIELRQQKGFQPFDMEQGNIAKSNIKQKKNAKNPFFESVSSSSGSSGSGGSSSSVSSSTEDLEEQRKPHASNIGPVKTSTLKEQKVGGEDFGASEQSMGSSKSMYRAGVEALLKESCPEELENLDELMNEYAGREEELIGQLSSMLASMNRSSDFGTGQEDQEDEHGTLISSVSSNTPGNDTSPVAYNEVQGQIKSALGEKSPSDEVQEEKGKAAAAAAATLFTGVSQKMGLGADWSSSDDSDDSSSSEEGSSEWSTDEGLSSVDASLETDGSSVVNTTPSMLAAIGVASSITKQVGVDDAGSLSSKSNDKETATKQELHEAIQAGDWTAVSATAALLANSEIPLRKSLSETSVSSGMSGSTLGQQSLERTSEFAKLVEEGDWEGVMRAAAQYEGASDTSSLYDSRHSMLDDLSAGGNRSDGSPNSQGHIDGIRAEVESLVRQVVPDEIDNIDEMLTQFKGREQDLINTLRTMQDQRGNTPGTDTESPNDLYASPGLISEAPSASNSVFESDSLKSPFWDDSSKTNSSINAESGRDSSTSSRSESNEK